MIVIFFLQCWPLMICQILSVGASIGTVIRLYKDSLVHPLTDQPDLLNMDRENRKRTFKILVTNIGSLLQTAAILKMLSVTLQISNRKPLTMTTLYFSYAIFVVLPVFLSCYNPLIFFILTPRSREFLCTVFWSRQRFASPRGEKGRMYRGIPMSTFLHSRDSEGPNNQSTKTSLA